MGIDYIGEMVELMDFVWFDVGVVMIIGLVYLE